MYLVGDTVWTSDVEKALLRFDPNVIIMNTGYAQVLGFEDSIIMGTKRYWPHGGTQTRG